MLLGYRLRTPAPAARRDLPPDSARPSRPSRRAGDLFAVFDQRYLVLVWLLQRICQLQVDRGHVSAGRRAWTMNIFTTGCACMAGIVGIRRLRLPCLCLLDHVVSDIGESCRNVSRMAERADVFCWCRISVASMWCRLPVRSAPSAYCARRRDPDPPWPYRRSASIDPPSSPTRPKLPAVGLLCLSDAIRKRVPAGGEL